jgi:hypothetical protein
MVRTRPALGQYDLVFWQTFTLLYLKADGSFAPSFGSSLECYYTVSGSPIELDFHATVVVMIMKGCWVVLGMHKNEVSD